MSLILRYRLMRYLSLCAWCSLQAYVKCPMKLFFWFGRFWAVCSYGKRPITNRRQVEGKVLWYAGKFLKDKNACRWFKTLELTVYVNITHVYIRGVHTISWGVCKGCPLEIFCFALPTILTSKIRLKINDSITTSK